VLKTRVIESEDDYGLGLAKGYTQRLKFTEGNTPVIVSYLKAFGNEIIYPAITNA